MKPKKEEESLAIFHIAGRALAEKENYLTYLFLFLLYHFQPSALSKESGAAEWLACLAHIPRVLDDAGSNPLRYHLEFFSHRRVA